MALVPSTLAAQLESALLQAKASSSPTAQTQLAQQMAQAIDAYVKSALVTPVVSGTAVGGVCTPLGPVAGAVVTGTGTGAPGVGLS